jgi:hypothetical protein
MEILLPTTIKRIKSYVHRDRKPRSLQYYYSL